MMLLSPTQGLWLLVPLLGWLAMRYLEPNKSPSSGVRLYHPAVSRLLAMAGASARPKNAPKPPWRLVYWGIIWLLMTIAMMEPALRDESTRIEGEGVDMVLAVDLSRSMLALDFSRDWRVASERVSRLDVVRSVLLEFVETRMEQSPFDRMGLVVFGSDAFVQSPLTNDGASLLEMLNSMEAGLAGDATSIGDAIALGGRLLQQSQAKSRVLVLLTDGENTAGIIQPNDAARLLKEHGIRFYAISIGASDMVPFPITGRFGTRVVQDHMPIDHAALQTMAKIADGEFLNASSPDLLKDIYNRINQLEKSTTSSETLVQYRPIYRWPLELAVVLLIIGLIPQRPMLLHQRELP